MYLVDVSGNGWSDFQIAGCGIDLQFPTSLEQMTTIENEIEIIILPGRHEAPPQTAQLTMQERIGISKLFGGGKLAEMIGAELLGNRQVTGQHTFQHRTMSAITRAVRRRLSEISKRATKPATI